MQKNHYFLISSLLCYVSVNELNMAKAKGSGAEGQLAVDTMPITCLVVSDRREFGIAQLAKAQQAAQQQFFKRVDHTSVEVVDVLVQNVSHLGLMTEEEFHGPRNPAQLEAEAAAIAAATGVKLELVPGTKEETPTVVVETEAIIEAANDMTV